MGEKLENTNPKLYKKINEREITADDEDEDVVDEFDSREIFGDFFLEKVYKTYSQLERTVESCELSDLIRNINDPEHPLTLEELNVVEQSLIEVDNKSNTVRVQFTPTIPHCSMSTLIGLSIRVQLLRALPPRFKVALQITPGTHSAEAAVNKQLADKERVAAALENNHLIEVINQCISSKS